MQSDSNMQNTLGDPAGYKHVICFKLRCLSCKMCLQLALNIATCSVHCIYTQVCYLNWNYRSMHSGNQVYADLASLQLHIYKHMQVSHLIQDLKDSFVPRLSLATTLLLAPTMSKLTSITSRARANPSMAICAAWL